MIPRVKELEYPIHRRSLHLPVAVAPPQPVVRPDEIQALRVEVLVHDRLLGEPLHQLVTAGGQRLAKVLGYLNDISFQLINEAKSVAGKSGCFYMSSQLVAVADI